jgi:hypothetical protein
LMRGCQPRVDEMHKPIITAQFEIAEGKVTQVFDEVVVVANSASNGEGAVEYEPIGLQRNSTPDDLALPKSVSNRVPPA